MFWRRKKKRGSSGNSNRDWSPLPSPKQPRTHWITSLAVRLWARWPKDQHPPMWCSHHRPVMTSCLVQPWKVLQDSFPPVTNQRKLPSHWNQANPQEVSIHVIASKRGCVSNFYCLKKWSNYVPLIYPDLRLFATQYHGEVAATDFVFEEQVSVLVTSDCFDSQFSVIVHHVCMRIGLKWSVEFIRPSLLFHALICCAQDLVPIPYHIHHLYVSWYNW